MLGFIYSPRQINNRSCQHFITWIPLHLGKHCLFLTENVDNDLFIILMFISWFIPNWSHHNHICTSFQRVLLSPHYEWSPELFIINWGFNEFSLHCHQSNIYITCYKWLIRQAILFQSLTLLADCYTKIYIVCNLVFFQLKWKICFLFTLSKRLNGRCFFVFLCPIHCNTCPSVFLQVVFVRNMEGTVVFISASVFLTKFWSPKRRLITPITCPFTWAPWISEHAESYNSTLTFNLYFFCCN